MKFETLTSLVRHPAGRSEWHEYTTTRHVIFLTCPVGQYACASLCCNMCYVHCGLEGPHAGDVCIEGRTVESLNSLQYLRCSY